MPVLCVLVLVLDLSIVLCTTTVSRNRSTETSYRETSSDPVLCSTCTCTAVRGIPTSSTVLAVETLSEIPNISNCLIVEELVDQLPSTASDYHSAILVVLRTQTGNGMTEMVSEIPSHPPVNMHF